MKGVYHPMQYIVIQSIDGISYKECPCCKENKPLTEFSPARKRRCNHISFCKTCQNERMKKLRKCAKIFCELISINKIIKSICPVCGIEFGVLHYQFHPTTKYCSHQCHSISMSKAYREKSPYAKKIKQLRKVHGL
jgi:hypothetical protein